MADQLEDWIPQEVARLQAEAADLQGQADLRRSEAEALQRALSRFLGQRASTPRAESAMNGQDADAAPKPLRPGPRPHKQTIVLNHIRRMGNVGLTVAQVLEFSAPELSMNRNATRAMLWNMKQDGRLRQEGDRYYCVDDATPENSETQLLRADESGHEEPQTPRGLSGEDDSLACLQPGSLWEPPRGGVA